MSSPQCSCELLLLRVEKLERQNRRFRTALLCLALLGGALVLPAARWARQGDTLEAAKIIIRDEHGRKRIVLGPDSHPKIAGDRLGIFVHDEEGKACVNLTASNGQARLSVEQESDIRLSLGTGEDRYAGLLVLANPGKSEQGQMCFFFTNDGQPALALNDSNHKTRIMMMLDKQQKPHLLLQDENQQAFFAQAQQ